VSSIVFVYMSDVEMCLDSISICFDVTFWVTFINGDMCQCDYCGRDNIYSISLLFYGEWALMMFEKYLCCLFV
jgi:hypothetical protein